MAVLIDVMLDFPQVGRRCLRDILEGDGGADGVENAGWIHTPRFQVGGRHWRRMGRRGVAANPAGLAEHAQTLHAGQLAADLLQHLRGRQVDKIYGGGSVGNCARQPRQLGSGSITAEFTVKSKC